MISNFADAATLKTPARMSHSSTSDSGEESERESESSHRSRRKGSKSIVAMRRPSIMAATTRAEHHFGSFYLRMGAVGN